MLGHLDQPGEDRVGIDLKYTGYSTDAQALRQRAHHPHQLLGRHALAMQRGAMGLLEVTFTADAIQLAPGTAVGMAIGAEIAPADPTPIGTVRVRAEVCRGVDLPTASSREDRAGWRRARRL